MKFLAIVIAFTPAGFVLGWWLHLQFQLRRQRRERYERVARMAKAYREALLATKEQS